MHFSWNKTNTYIALFTIFACLLGMRIYISNEKQMLVGDESLSFVISSASTIGWNTLPEDGTIMTTTAIKNNMYTIDGGAKELFRDIYHLHLNVKDAPHTNLYYTLLRIASHGIKSEDVKSLIQRGLILNIILFAASFFCAWWLSGMLISKVSIRLLSLTTAFMMYSSVHNTLLLRTYELQGLAFLLFTIVFLKNIPMAKDVNNDTISYTKFITAALSLAFAFLSGYFAMLYVAFLGLGLITIALCKKNYTYIKYALSSFSAAFIVSYGVYASFLVFLVEGNPITANKPAFDIIANANTALKMCLDFAVTTIFKPLPLCFLGVFFIYFIAHRKTNKQIHGPHIFMLAIGITWCFLVMLLTPNKTMGYLMPFFPILMLLIYTFIDALKKFGSAFALVLTLCIAAAHLPVVMSIATPFTPEKHDRPIIFSLKLPWTLAGNTQHYDANNTIIFKNTCETLVKSIQSKQANLYVIDGEMYASCPDIPHDAITFEKNLYYSKAFVLKR